ncbi:peptidase inhibitor family I36 protein [Streptomyces thermolilacinus]|uniref:peptidase inhibitor family I36 protein n=1 Tax=Streptomyces thermolilacinus TaxID=285540 RepID=UPI0033F88A7D
MRPLRHRIRSGVPPVALALATLSSWVMTPTAAAEEFRPCPPRRVCLWNADDVRLAAPPMHRIDLTDTAWDDSVWHLRNRTPWTYCAYQHADEQRPGRYIQIEPFGYRDLSQNTMRRMISVLVREECPTS